MNDLADVWLDFDDTDECTDLWHLGQGPHAHEDVCPSCGYVDGGVDDGRPWPGDVFLPVESAN